MPAETTIARSWVEYGTCALEFANSILNAPRADPKAIEAANRLMTTYLENMQKLQLADIGAQKP